MDISRRVLPGARRYSHICLSWDATGSGPADCFTSLRPPKPLLALSRGLYLLLSSAVLLPRHPLFLLIFPSLFSAASTSVLALPTFVSLSTLSLRILFLQQICYPRLFLMVPLWDQLFLCVCVCSYLLRESTALVVIVSVSTYLCFCFHTPNSKS